MSDLGVVCKEKLDVNHSKGIKWLSHLFFFFVLISFFCRNGTAYLILVRIGLQYIKGWLGAILLKMTQLSCIAIAWQYFSAAWFKWIYHKNLPQESTKSLFFS